MADAFPNNSETGLTQRDYFAAKALQALILRPNTGAGTSGDQQRASVAKEARELADALVTELAS